MTLSPRQQAASAGLTHYAGKPCKRGHLTGHRYTSTGACIDCTDELQRATRGTAKPRAKRRMVEVSQPDDFAGLL